MLVSIFVCLYFQLNKKKGGTCHCSYRSSMCTCYEIRRLHMETLVSTKSHSGISTLANKKTETHTCGY